MKTIIKITFLALVTSFMFACGSSQKENPVVQMETYKKQVSELNKKIEDIEKDINTTSHETYTGIKVPVLTQVLHPELFSHYFEAAGELETIDEAFISPEVNGQVVHISVKEGQMVKKGQTLARLNTVVIEKNIQELDSQLSLAETIYKKQSALWEKNIGSERQFLEAKNNYENLQIKLATLKAQYNMSIIVSPINGIVETIVLKEGEMASPGMKFMRIVNIDELFLTAQLSETYLPVVKKGEEVTITFPTYPGIKMSKPIHRTGNVINKENRTFEVQVKLDNPTGVLKPNMLANMEINDYNNEQALVVPSVLIRNDMKGSYIYLADKKDVETVARKQYVTIGKSFKDKTEVVAGLTEGDIYITDGYSNVSDGAVVKVMN